MRLLLVLYIMYISKRLNLSLYIFLYICDNFFACCDFDKKVRLDNNWLELPPIKTQVRSENETLMRYNVMNHSY